MKMGYLEEGLQSSSLAIRVIAVERSLDHLKANWALLDESHWRIKDFLELLEVFQEFEEGPKVLFVSNMKWEVADFLLTYETRVQYLPPLPLHLHSHNQEVLR